LELKLDSVIVLPTICQGDIVSALFRLTKHGLEKPVGTVRRENLVEHILAELILA
jgi:hypothetical protein